MNKKKNTPWFKKNIYQIPIVIVAGYLLTRILIDMASWAMIYTNNGSTGYNITPHRLLMIAIAFIMIVIATLSVRKILNTKLLTERISYVAYIVLALYVAYYAAYSGILIGAFTNF